MRPDHSPHDVVVMQAVSVMASGTGLSERQLELLTRLTRGLSRTEVAEEMGVTVAAVDYHGRVVRQITGLGPRELVVSLLHDEVVAARLGEEAMASTRRGGALAHGRTGASE